MTYKEGTVVSYFGDLFKAKGGDSNCSKPDDVIAWAIYVVFDDPSLSFLILHIT